MLISFLNFLFFGVGVGVGVNVCVLYTLDAEDKLMDEYKSRKVSLKRRGRASTVSAASVESSQDIIDEFMSIDDYNDGVDVSSHLQSNLNYMIPDSSPPNKLPSRPSSAQIATPEAQLQGVSAGQQEQLQQERASGNNFGTNVLTNDINMNANRSTLSLSTDGPALTCGDVAKMGIRAQMTDPLYAGYLCSFLV